MTKKVKADNLIKSLPTCIFDELYVDGQGQKVLYQTVPFLFWLRMLRLIIVCIQCEEVLVISRPPDEKNDMKTECQHSR